MKLTAFFAGASLSLSLTMRRHWDMFLVSECILVQRKQKRSTQPTGEAEKPLCSSSRWHISYWLSETRPHVNLSERIQAGPPVLPLVAFPSRRSPDSAARVLSPTGNTPESRSKERGWRILGITRVWRRTRWGGTTPPAPSTSKAVSTHLPDAQRSCCCCCCCCLS